MVFTMLSFCTKSSRECWGAGFANLFPASLPAASWIVSMIAATIYILALVLQRLKLDGKPKNEEERHCIKERRQLPPGPSPWPFVGNMLQANDLPHRWFANLSERYGPILYLQMGSNPYVIVNNVETAREALKTRDAEFASRPKSMFAEVVSFNYEDMVFRSSDAKWRALRKLCASYMFTTTALKMSAALRQEEMLAMVSSVHSAAMNCSLINIKRATYEANLSSICRILFGKRYLRADQELNPEAKCFLDLLDRISRESGRINLGDFFPALQWLDLQGTEKRLRTDMKQALENFFFPVLSENRKLLAEKQRSRKTNAGEQHFLDVLQSLEGEDKLSDSVIAGVLCDLILAGTDTTSVTVEWAFSELLANPDVMGRAQREIDSVVGNQRSVQESDLSNLPYLQAIVKETLRLHPALPLGIPHYNSHTTQLSGYTIPAGTTLLVNISAIGRDPATWNNPTMFYPDRFLGSDIQLVAKQFQFIPFSAGRRHCLGYPLVLIQVPHILATLLQAFEWSVPTSAGQRAEEEGIAVSMKERIGLACYRAVPLELVASRRHPIIDSILPACHADSCCPLRSPPAVRV